MQKYLEPLEKFNIHNEHTKQVYTLLWLKDQNRIKILKNLYISCNNCYDEMMYNKIY